MNSTNSGIILGTRVQLVGCQVGKKKVLRAGSGFHDALFLHGTPENASIQLVRRPTRRRITRGELVQGRIYDAYS